MVFPGFSRRLFALVVLYFAITLVSGKEAWSQEQRNNSSTSEARPSFRKAYILTNLKVDPTKKTSLIFSFSASEGRGIVTFALPRKLFADADEIFAGTFNTSAREMLLFGYVTGISQPQVMTVSFSNNPAAAKPKIKSFAIGAADPSSGGAVSAAYLAFEKGRPKNAAKVTTEGWFRGARRRRRCATPRTCIPTQPPAPQPSPVTPGGPPPNVVTPVPPSRPNPQPPSVPSTAPTGPCPDACQSVTIRCGPPGNSSAPTSPEAPSSLTSAADAPSGVVSRGDLPCGDSMFVQRHGNGVCSMCIGTGPFSEFVRESAPGLCGTTMSIDDFNRRYHRLRNSVTSLDLDVVLGSLSGEALADAIYSFFHLAGDMCTLADEFYHLVNQYPCLHHAACDEARSTESHQQCTTNPLTVNFIERLLRYLDKVELFTGAEDKRTQYKSAMITLSCSDHVQFDAGAKIENCLCCSTRDGTSTVTAEDCASCVESVCPILGQPSISQPSLPSYCRGFDAAGARAAMCAKYLAGSGAHTCSHYISMPPPLTSLTRRGSNVQSPFGSSAGVTCTLPPPRATPSPPPLSPPTGNCPPESPQGSAAGPNPVCRIEELL